MPRELQKRGRREEKKRKAQNELSLDSVKKLRYDEDHPSNYAALEIEGEAGDDYISFNNNAIDGQEQPQVENQFYGLLDEAEQSYYASVNAKLNADDFESDEDRALFVQAVHRETHGKEMKVASSQSCSRYLERIIMLSLPDQLRSLFTAFLENLAYLVQHRFGSHCCEALFLKSSEFVKADRKPKDQDANLEDLFLLASEQLQPNLGYLITDRFATHSIRILLLVLSGEGVDESTRKVVASKRKEQVEVGKMAKQHVTGSSSLPKSFAGARDNLITAAFSGLDTTYVRALATHPTGNPFLQVVLRLELTLHGKQGDTAHQLLFPNLFPDQDFQSGSETETFIQGLLYDPTGSHLVETLVQYLPGRQFKKLYANILKGKMRNLVKNDVASYVAIRVIERLGKDDLAEVRDMIIPDVDSLLNRSRLNLIKTLFDRFVVRQVDSKSLAAALFKAYGADKMLLLPNMLRSNTNQVAAIAEIETKETKNEKGDLHSSLLVQSMLKDPAASRIIQDSFLAQSPADLLVMANTPITSRAIQAALTSPQSSPQFRKQMVPKFYGLVSEMAVTVAGSHVVDALWEATEGLHFIKENVARELSQNESIIRDSTYGRTVWRNWSMDVYLRRPNEWRCLAKTDGARDTPGQKPSETVEGHAHVPQMKSAIQLARERHAKLKNRPSRPENAMKNGVLAST